MAMIWLSTSFKETLYYAWIPVLIIGIFYGIQRVRRQSDRKCVIRICRGGISFECGAHAGSFRWDDIQSIHIEPGGQEGRTVIYAGLNIFTPAWHLFASSRSVGDIVSTRVTPARWKTMIATFDRGAAFDFGCVTSTATSLSIGSKSYQWAHLQSVGVEGRYLVVTPLAGNPVRKLAVEASFVSVLERLAQYQLFEGRAYKSAALPPTIPSSEVLDEHGNMADIQLG